MSLKLGISCCERQTSPFHSNRNISRLRNMDLYMWHLEGLSPTNSRLCIDIHHRCVKHFIFLPWWLLHKSGPLSDRKFVSAMNSQTVIRDDFKRLVEVCTWLSVGWEASSVLLGYAELQGIWFPHRNAAINKVHSIGGLSRTVLMTHCWNGRLTPAHALTSSWDAITI